MSGWWYVAVVDIGRQVLADHGVEGVVVIKIIINSEEEVNCR